MQFPAGIGPEGLSVMEPAGEQRGPVTIVSMNGRRFNGTLSRLLRHRCGRKIQVRFDDFRIIADDSPREPGSLARVLEELKDVDESTLAGILPLPPQEGWKFAGILPDRFFRAMILSDYYHAVEFLAAFRRSGISILPAAETAGRE